MTTELRDELVLGRTKAVAHLCGKVAMVREDERPDLEQSVMLRLIRYTPRFDPTKASYVTFADRHIRGGIADYFRSIDPLGRPHRKSVKRNEETFDLCQWDESLKQLTEEPAVDTSLWDLRKALCSIEWTPRQREVLDLLLQGIDQREISHRLGCNDQNISLMRTRIVAKLRRYLSHR